MKTVRAIQKNTACLQNEPIIGSLSHSIKFFRKKIHTVRQQKYCDKLAENFKSVFVLTSSWLAYFISTFSKFCCLNDLHFL